MSDPAYTNVFNSKGEFLFGLFNRWGGHMTDMAGVVMRLYRDLYFCVDDADRYEALRTLLKKGWKIGVYDDNDDGWYRTDDERKYFESLFAGEEHEEYGLFTTPVEKMKDSKILAHSAFNSFTLGETIKPIDLIWEEECPEDYEEDLEDAEELPSVLVDEVTLDNWNEAFDALTNSPWFYERDGIYYNMDA